MTNCPNHDDDQICPDCTMRIGPPTVDPTPDSPQCSCLLDAADLNSRPCPVHDRLCDCQAKRGECCPRCCSAHYPDGLAAAQLRREWDRARRTSPFTPPSAMQQIEIKGTVTGRRPTEVTSALAQYVRQQGRCPTCDSPAPNLHPAVQHEGEVSPCDDPFHGEYRPHEGESEADFTRRVYGGKPATSSLPPIEQHKADLEMIIAACRITGGVGLGVRGDYHTAAEYRIAKLAQALLDRIPAKKPALVEHKVTVYPDSAICYDLSCEWRERGANAHELAIAHARETGHPVNVETMCATMYQPSGLGRVEGDQR